MIYCAMRGQPEKQRGFIKFNTRPFLVLVHFMNFVAALLDFLYAEPMMGATDFEKLFTFTMGFVYLLFYVFFLDTVGWHFYVVFTPRTNWCAVTYSCALALYAGLIYGWDAIGR